MPLYLISGSAQGLLSQMGTQVSPSTAPAAPRAARGRGSLNPSLDGGCPASVLATGTLLVELVKNTIIATARPATKQVCLAVSRHHLVEKSIESWPAYAASSRSYCTPFEYWCSMYSSGATGCCTGLVRNLHVPFRPARQGNERELFRSCKEQEFGKKITKISEIFCSKWLDLMKS